MQQQNSHEAAKLEHLYTYLLKIFTNHLGKLNSLFVFLRVLSCFPIPISKLVTALK